MAVVTVTCLWLAILTTPGGAGDEGESVAELVERLGAPRYADREAAGEALVGLGPAALPGLRQACMSPDLEVRSRAEVLVARVEAAEALRATPVRLEARDLPVAEAVAALERESGMRIRPAPVHVPGNPMGRSAWPDRRVSLVIDGSVPFWEAVDRLCGAGELQPLYAPGGEPFFPWKPPFQLSLIPGRARPPASVSGALKVELLRVRYDRDLDYGHDDAVRSPLDPAIVVANETRAGATVGSSYRAEMLVSAEPRLRIIGVGRVERLEAVDERGRSLAKSPTDQEGRAREQMLQMNPHLDPALNPELRYNTGATSVRGREVAVPLAYPSPRAGRIATLRGVIPVAVLARRPGPLEVELRGAKGRTFGVGPTRITVNEITARPNAEPTVDLTLEVPPDGPEETIAVCDPKGTRLRVRRPADLVELRLEVIDGRGEPAFWQFTSTPTERTRGRMAIVVHRRGDEVVEPESLRLRYWETAGAVIELPFSFADVPTP